MPELPEVETVRRELAPWLTGRRIRSAQLADAPTGAKYARLAEAQGRRIVDVLRRGKFLLLPLSGERELVVHLGMTGKLLRERPRAHLRIVLELSGRAPRRLYFEDARRFGRFLVVPAGDYHSLPTLHRMGPEPLDDGFTAVELLDGLRSGAAIKAHLLSQRPVAGLGNIYVDEALWRARIHPTQSSHSLSRRKATALHAAIRAVLRESIAAQGTTFSDYRTVGGSTGSFGEQLAVYGRQADPCPRCERPIAKTVVAGRGTHFCPRCQRPPRPPARAR